MGEEVISAIDSRASQKQGQAGLSSLGPEARQWMTRHEMRMDYDCPQIDMIASVLYGLVLPILYRSPIDPNQSQRH